MEVKIIKDGREVPKEISAKDNLNDIQIDVNFEKAFLKRITLMEYKNSTVFNLGLLAAEQIDLNVDKDIVEKLGIIIPVVTDFLKESIEKDIKSICDFDIGDGFSFDFMSCKITNKELTEIIEVLLKGNNGDIEKNMILGYEINDYVDPRNCLFRID